LGEVLVFLAVLRARDPLPLIALLLRREKAAVNLQHEHGISVSKLPRNELDRRACSGRAHRVAVPVVAQLVVVDVQRSARLAMLVVGRPTVNAGEELRVRQPAGDE
jgi:hypothetical protein